MKFNFITALAIIGFMVAFSSCKDKEDDPVKPGIELVEKTYTATEGLTLTVNGNPTLGKVATFTPTEKGTATIVLAGAPLDLGEIIGMASRYDGSEFNFPTAGVLPGSTSLTITTGLKGDADKCTFDGKGETQYCTYSYSGEVTAETMAINFTDVILKNTTLAGTWTLPELYQMGDWGYEEANIFNVARIVWEAEKGVELSPGWPMPVASIVGASLVMPMIGEGDNLKSPVEMLSLVLKSVTFTMDGNITAEYVDTKDLTKAPVKSPAGLAQYVITSDGTLLLYLNPAAIIANTASIANIHSSRAADILGIIEQLMGDVVPMLSQGVPVHYGAAITDDEGNINEDANVQSFYLGTETLLPILKIVSPIFADEDIVNAIVEEASKDPNMGSFAFMLPGILNSMPEIINTTSKIEIGINLKR